ncbi:hypothetical protein ABID65_006554 [Bradyrhizobium sp. S3.9.2]|uniref:hypothetical protein n=1 Tax=Bradyrhizobium sp. S3.9.2 TaxID=3156432 RepID=UPI0033958D02
MNGSRNSSYRWRRCDCGGCKLGFPREKNILSILRLLRIEPLDLLTSEGVLNLGIEEFADRVRRH